MVRECCREGHALGFRSFVLQGGEDGYFTDSLMTDTVRRSVEPFPDLPQLMA